MLDKTHEFWDLLNALCDSRLTQEQAARLESLVLSSPEARWHYLTYLDLHGTLYWDAAAGLAISPADLAVDHAEGPLTATGTTKTARRRWSPQVVAAISGLAAAVLIAVAFWQFPRDPAGPTGDLVGQHGNSSQGTVTPAVAHDPAEKSPRPHSPRGPLQLPGMRHAPVESDAPEVSPTIAAHLPEKGVPENTTPENVDENDSASQARTASIQRPVALINSQISEGWNAAGITPSERADDASWLRRVYLDLAGHIPTWKEAQRFLTDRRPDKRERLVDELLDDPDFVRQLTTQWSNLLVGRAPGETVNRPALQKFLRTSFAANRGWDEIVTELVSAEGRGDENGAANFLIAHLNNQAVPATAITARLFLGKQVQCTQCHNHPSGVAKQTEFWEFNSFFHQTQSKLLTERDPKSGQMNSRGVQLVSEDIGGPTYYESPTGVMKVAYPRYHGQEISPDPSVNRRQELARLMVEVDGPQLSAAFVNRTWQHFFGFGFTRQVDDMGVHNPPSHPELLEGLAAAFRQSGYDIRQLTRWIVLSEPYQLSSTFNETNQVDDPEKGETPLFSRVYPQPMSLEQLYDSFLIATKAHQSGTSDWTSAEAQRQAWLQQFIISFQTDENDEANMFEGTVTQALTLMNGPLVEKALEADAGTLLGEVLRSPGGEAEKIEKLCLAALSRKPSPKELAAMHKLVRSSAQRAPQAPAPGIEGYQDLFWALLNSNEFAVVY